MSKQAYSKIERRRRKYKKRQIEWIGWFYEDVNETKVLELLNVITLINDNEDNINFYKYIFNMAYLQAEANDIGDQSYEVVHKFVIPVILNKLTPLIMNQRTKCLFLYQFYSKLWLKIYDSSIEALNSLLKPKDNVRYDIMCDIVFVNQNNSFEDWLRKSCQCTPLPSLLNPTIFLNLSSQSHSTWTHLPTYANLSVPHGYK